MRLIIFLIGLPNTDSWTTTVTARWEHKVFQNAYGRMENIVMTILTAWLQSDGGVAWNMGAGLIVNDDGDFITAAHVLTCISRPPVAGNPPGSYTTKFGTTEAVFDGGYIHEELDFGWGKLKGYTPPPNHQFPIATAEPDWSYYVGRAVTVMAIRAILDQHNAPYLSR